MTKTPEFIISIHQLQTDVDTRFLPFWAASSQAGLLRVAYGLSKNAFIEVIFQQYPQSEFIVSSVSHPALIQISEYLNGNRAKFTIPLDLRSATPFQQAVWQAVAQIPYGKIRTYGQIAEQIGKPNAARAVGSANGSNPLPIIIPCHRLIGTDGSLRGFGGRGGIQTKQFLLEFEQKNLLKNPS